MCLVVGSLLTDCACVRWLAAFSLTACVRWLAAFSLTVLVSGGCQPFHWLYLCLVLVSLFTDCTWVTCGCQLFHWLYLCVVVGSLAEGRSGPGQQLWLVACAQVPHRHPQRSARQDNGDREHQANSQPRNLQQEHATQGAPWQQTQATGWWWVLWWKTWRDHWPLSISFFIITISILNRGPPIAVANITVCHWVCQQTAIFADVYLTSLYVSRRSPRADAHQDDSVHRLPVQPMLCPAADQQLLLRLWVPGPLHLPGHHAADRALHPLPHPVAQEFPLQHAHRPRWHGQDRDSQAPGQGLLAVGEIASKGLSYLWPGFVHMARICLAVRFTQLTCHWVERMRCADSVLVLFFCSVSVIVSCGVSELCIAGCVGYVLVSCLMFLTLCHVCLSCAFCKICLSLCCIVCWSSVLLAVQMLSSCHA